MTIAVPYVLGFAFDPYGAVALIKKARPDWQKHKWNGIGGHRNPLEEPVEAMVREFEEEAGVCTGKGHWRLAGHMRAAGAWHCWVFTATLDKGARLRSVTDEPVQFVPADQVHKYNTIENVPYLLELCHLPADHTGKVPLFTFDYT